MSRKHELPKACNVAYVSGLNRLGYNPRMAGVALWLVGVDLNQEIQTNRLVEESNGLLAPYVDPEYVERYLGKLTEAQAPLEEPQRTQRRLIDDTIIESEAILRKFALRDLGLDSAQVTTAFSSHPKYNAAVGGLRVLEPMIRELGSLRVTICPTCLLVGSISTWFGYRVLKGKRIPQSWCVVCRALGNTDAMDKRVQELFGSDSWFALSKWGKETGTLTPWERGFAYNMGMAIARGWTLSEKQISSANRLASKALELGFKP